MGRKSRKLPIKWMSTEAIIDQIFTTYSDVYVLSSFVMFSFMNFKTKLTYRVCQNDISVFAKKCCLQLWITLDETPRLK